MTEDELALQKQINELRNAMLISNQMHASNLSTNISGYVNSGIYGFRSIIESLNSNKQYQQKIRSPIEEIENSSILYAAPSVYYPTASKYYSAESYRRAAIEGLKTRASHFVGSAALSTLSFAPNIALGAAAAAGGAGALGTVAAGAGLTLGLPAFAGLAAFGYGVNAVRDELKEQDRLENMLLSMSRGKKTFIERSNIARSIRGALANSPEISSDNAREILAYGNQHQLLDINNSTDEFKRNYNSLLKSVKTIMKTFHQSAKDAVKTMSDLKNSGVFDLNDMRRSSLLIEARTSIAKISRGEMLALGKMGAQASRGALAAKHGAELATMGSGLLYRMNQAGFITDEDLFEATGQTGSAARQSMALSATRGMSQFIGSTNLGRYLVAGMYDEHGNVNNELRSALYGGKVDAINKAISNVSSQMSQRDPLTVMYEAKRNMRNLTMTDTIRLMTGAVKSYAKNYGLNPRNPAHVRQILSSSLGITDEAALKQYTSMIVNEDVTKGVLAEDQNDRLKLLLSDRDQRLSLITRLKKIPRKLFYIASEPFVSLRNRVSESISSLMPSDRYEYLKYSGGDIETISSEVRDESIYRTSGYSVASDEIENAENKEFYELLKNREIKNEGIRTFIWGKEALKSDYDIYQYKKYKKDTWSRWYYESRARQQAFNFKKFTEKNKDVLMKALSPENLKKMRDKYGGRDFRKKIRSVLESRAKTPDDYAAVSALMTGLTTEAGAKSIRREISLINTYNTASTLGRSAYDVLDKIGSEEQSALGEKLMSSLKALSEGGVTKEEIIEFGKAASNVNANIIEDEAIREEFKTMVNQTKSLMSGTLPPEKRTRNKVFLNTVERLPGSLTRIEGYLKSIAERGE